MHPKCMVTLFTFKIMILQLFKWCDLRLDVSKTVLDCHCMSLKSQCVMLVGRFEVRTSDHLTISLYDRLVSNDVLDLVGPGARLLYVGKTAGYHSRTQVKIMSFFGCGKVFKLWFWFVLDVVDKCGCLWWWQLLLRCGHSFVCNFLRYCGIANALESPLEV